MKKEILNTIKEKYFRAVQLMNEYNNLDPSETDITYMSWLRKEISDIDDFFRHLPDNQGLD